MRRLTFLLTVATVLVGVPWANEGVDAEPTSDADGAEQERTDGEPGESSDHENGADEEGPADPTDTESSDASGSMADTPAAYTVGVGLNPGILFWDTPYGGRETTFTLMATGHARILPPLIGSLSVGYARRAPSAGTLVVANDHVTALAGFGAEGWLETLRVSAQAQGGVLSRRLTITDGSGATYRDSRFAPAAGGRFSVGASFGESMLVSLVSGFRFFPPERSEFYTGIEAGWLFLHSH